MQGINFLNFDYLKNALTTSFDANQAFLELQTQILGRFCTKKSGLIDNVYNFGFDSSTYLFSGFFEQLSLGPITDFVLSGSIADKLKINVLNESDVSSSYKERIRQFNPNYVFRKITSVTSGNQESDKLYSAELKYSDLSTEELKIIAERSSFLINIFSQDSNYYNSASYKNSPWLRLLGNLKELHLKANPNADVSYRRVGKMTNWRDEFYCYGSGINLKLDQGCESILIVNSSKAQSSDLIGKKCVVANVNYDIEATEYHSRLIKLIDF
jgi:hypothetical protein